MNRNGVLLGIWRDTSVIDSLGQPALMVRLSDEHWNVVMNMSEPAASYECGCQECFPTVIKNRLLGLVEFAYEELILKGKTLEEIRPSQVDSRQGNTRKYDNHTVWDILPFRFGLDTDATHPQTTERSDVSPVSLKTEKW